MKEKKSMLTRVLVLSAIIMICLVFMASCAKPGDSDKQQENGSSQTDADTENKGDDPSEDNKGEDPSEDNEGNDPSEENKEEPGENMEQTGTPTKPVINVEPLMSEEEWEKVWQEAPPVWEELSKEEIRARRMEVLSKATVLSDGVEANKGYFTSDLEFLKKANDNDALVLIYTCDIASHVGWGIVAFYGDRVDGTQPKQPADFKAESPADTECAVTVTIAELKSSLSVDNFDDFTNFQAGTWNGGHILGLYYLDQSLVEEWRKCNDEVSNSRHMVHTYTGELSNENSIENAKILYDYLKEIYGKYCLTGQMESTNNVVGSPEYEVDYLLRHTGKLPAMRGFDFIKDDFQGVTDRALAWWQKGGIPTICWHTGPDFSSGYEECLNDNINWDEAFVPGSDTYNMLISGMDKAVPYLKQLEDANVPVLWRPFHELDGGWFWWSRGGAESFVKLWQMMYSRYTDYWGLNNLIWVLGYSQSGGDYLASWYPGDSYVDIAGADKYPTTENTIDYLYGLCEQVAPEGMPLALHECSKIPNAEEMKDCPWLFFLVWHTIDLTDTMKQPLENLKAVYNDDFFITLDELPKFGA